MISQLSAKYQIGAIHTADTVEPLTNDHPHQRPSLSYDRISCDGQWFLFVYESLTSDHPSYTTTRDSEGGRIRGVLLYYQMWWFVTESIRARVHRLYPPSIVQTPDGFSNRLCLDLTWPYYTRKPDTRANRVPDGFRLCLDLTWPYYTRKPDTPANRDSGMEIMLQSLPFTQRRGGFRWHR